MGVEVIAYEWMFTRDGRAVPIRSLVDDLKAELEGPYDALIAAEGNMADAADAVGIGMHEFPKRAADGAERVSDWVTVTWIVEDFLVPWMIARKRHVVGPDDLRDLIEYVIERVRHREEAFSIVAGVKRIMKGNTFSASSRR